MSGPKTVSMADGAGGEATQRLLREVFLPPLTNPWLAPLADAAVIPLPGQSARDQPAGRGELALTTDSFVVRPLQFPGGSLGSLAVHGTVNDLAMVGARPCALAAAFVLEAGLSRAVLTREVEALAGAARAIGVPIVTGDTKVVERGKADGMYVTTSGIGLVDSRCQLGSQYVEPGDVVLLSGPIGNHGIAVLLAREELDLQAEIFSDSRPLTALVQALIEELGADLKWMRDATRGGVATVLHELSQAIQWRIVLEEEQIPLDAPVRGACELLGLDPLHVANEGQFVAVVRGNRSQDALRALRATPGGERAGIVGQITSQKNVGVVVRSAYGGQRVVDVLTGDPLPRIC